MKIYILIILLLQFSQSKSQNLDSIKKADTVYVYFKDDKKLQKYNKVERSNNIIDEYFFFPNDKYPSFMHFNHLRNKHINLKEKKSFLKKKKDVLITYDFISKFNTIEACELICRKKKIFLIDDKDVGWFSFKLQEVQIYGNYRFSEE